jgi:hypothetical protein
MSKIHVEHIKSLSDFRSKLIEKDNNEKASEQEILRIDELEEEILGYIKQHFNLLPFEFIMDELSKLGWCPSLLYDDNGHWAISTTGFQNVPEGDDPEDIEIFNIVKKEQWENSPREALYKYLHNN